MAWKLNPFTGELDYYEVGSGGGISDGDKGDVVVSGGGATWTVDTNSITNNKLAQAAANTVKGNNTNALANETDIALTIKTILGRNAADIVALPFNTFIERLSGTTANRSVVYPSPLIGQLYSNTDTGRLEWYDGTAWRSIPFAQILLSEIQNIANNTFLGNLTGSSTYPQQVVGLDIWDPSQQSYTYNIAGINEWFGTTLFTQTNSVTVANTVTETSLLGTGAGTKTLPANFFVAGKELIGQIVGYIANTGSPNIRFRIKLGATTILDSTATAMLAITGTNRFEINYRITCRTTGVSGTVIAQAMIKYYRDLSTEVPISIINTTTTTINTTTTQVVDTTVEWGTASVSNTITSTNFNLSKLA
jgi:hypothetical protein